MQIWMAASPTERSIARYWRAKLGLSQFTLDLPRDELVTALLADGWLRPADCDDDTKIKDAAERMIGKWIRSTARRAVESLSTLP
jgi:uncharacterized heparinase superfamily protein